MPAAAAAPLAPIANPAAPGPAYLSATKRAFIDAAIAGLVPNDGLGRGAKEARTFLGCP